MTYKYDRFPVQAKPIYAFHIVEGRLRRRTYTRYETVQYGFNRTKYRIHTGKSIVDKTVDQMDRVLSGWVFTFDPDPGRILDLMAERAGADTVKAAVMTENATQFRRDVIAASKTPCLDEPWPPADHMKKEG